MILYLNLLLIFSVFHSIGKGHGSSMSDAMWYACANAKTPEKAERVIECGSPPREVYTFLKSCNEAMKLQGVITEQSRVFDEIDPVKKLHIMCQTRRNDDLYKKTTYNIPVPSECKPTGEIYGKMKIHYRTAASRTGQIEITQCLYRAIA